MKELGQAGVLLIKYYKKSQLQSRNPLESALIVHNAS